MTIHRTGNAEIDRQHEILESLVDQLAALCSEAKRKPDVVCEKCNSMTQQQCTSSLVSITNALTVSLIGHSTYEEKMMELLPDTPSCQAHKKAHKAAHEEMSKRMKVLSLHIANGNPRAVSTLMGRDIGIWLSDHMSLFDDSLACHEQITAREIDLDGDLVTMLDEYAFPNRPTLAKNSSDTDLALKSKNLEVRGRFELLTPAQLSVFWLVVSGKKNREIAEQLSLTINTIKTHRAAIFQKLEVGSLLELVKKADALRRINRPGGRRRTDTM